MILIDEEQHIPQANKVVQTHIGVAPQGIIGKYCPRVIHDIDGPFEGCPLEEAGIKVSFKVTGKERRLPPAVETTLFRVT